MSRPMFEGTNGYRLTSIFHSPAELDVLHTVTVGDFEIPVLLRQPIDQGAARFPGRCPSLPKETYPKAPCREYD